MKPPFLLPSVQRSTLRVQRCFALSQALTASPLRPCRTDSRGLHSTFASSRRQPGLAAAPRSSGAVAVQPFRNPKSKIQNPASAFTLIELLVVISILVILGALAFPAISGALDRAKKVAAKNDLLQIVTAVNAFYTEYGRYPVDPGIPSTGHDVEYGNPDSPSHTNSEVMNALRAIDDPNGPNKGHALNPRRVVFFNGPMVKDPARPRGGFDANGEFWDPWGSPNTAASTTGHYIINIDANYDNVTQAYTLDYSDLMYDTSTGKGVRGGVIAASLGKDGDYGKKGNKVYSGSDDVLSWQ